MTNGAIPERIQALLARGSRRAAARLLLAEAAPWAAALLDALPADGPHGAMLAERLRFGPPQTWRGWRAGWGTVTVKLDPGAPPPSPARAGFRHPGVVPLLAHGAGWSLFAWVPGPTLAVELAASRRPAAARLDEIAAAIAALHAAGLAHGDLTPANVVLSDGGAVLIDWGEDCAGTPGWRPDRPHDARARDLFALGRLRHLAAGNAFPWS